MPYKTIILKVDTETEEVVEERVVYGDYRVKLISENSVKAFKVMNDGTVDINKGEQYTKVYRERMRHLKDLDLSPNEMRLILTILGTDIKYQTGELIQENNRLTNTLDLIQESGIEINRGRIALQSLVARGVIDREPHRKGYKYYVNPFIFECGNSIDAELSYRFKETDFAKIFGKRDSQYGTEND